MGTNFDDLQARGDASLFRFGLAREQHAMVTIMMLLAGVLLIVVGLGAGGALLASSLGWLTATYPATLWIAFPLCAALGVLIAALGARLRSVPILLRSTGTVMLLFALTAVSALVMAGAGMVAAPRGTAALWYVFAIGLMAGTANFLAPAAPGEPA